MPDLILETLHLHNFKGFAGLHTLQLDRAPGLYLIAGQNKLDPQLGANGVGKTTIFDALMWVLWGKTGRDNRPGAAIIPWSGEKDKGNSVELLFQRNKEKYWLRRSRNPNELVMNNADGGECWTVTQEDIPKFIGMSEELFRRAMFWGQFGDMFLDLRPEEQSRMFTEALHLDVWLKCAAAADTATKKADARVIEVSAERDALKSTLADIADQIKENNRLSDNFNDECVTAIERQTEELGTVCTKIKQHSTNHRKPTAPTPSPRTKEILDEMDAEPDRLAKAKQTLSRKAGPQKQCPKCKQLVVDDTLQEQLRLAEAFSAKKLSDLRKELITLNDKHAEANRKYTQAMQEYGKHEHAIASLRGQEQFLRKQIAATEEKPDPYVEENKRLKQRKDQKQDQLVQATQVIAQQEIKREEGKFWSKAFKDIRLSVIDDCLLELEIASARHAGLLGLEDWGIRFETERETKQGNVSYSFTVMLYPPDEKKPIKWESYSGGESQRLQLAVAFGLAEVLLARAGVEPNMELIDEPTKGLSAEGISDLLEHLRERAIELKRAVYLIDHHSLDRGAFDGTLLVTKTDKGSSFKWV